MKEWKFLCNYRIFKLCQEVNEYYYRIFWLKVLNQRVHAVAKLNGNNSDVNITQTFIERVRALSCIDTAVLVQSI